MQKLLHYDITRKLGEGKNGETFLAYDSGLQRPVVIKVLKRKERESDVWQKSFDHQMSILSAIDDKRIAFFYAREQSEGKQFIIREFVEGSSFRSLAEKQPVNYAKFLRLALGVAEGLRTAHNRGLVHGNITPDNIFVTSGDQVRLTDFCLGMGQSSAGSAPVSVDNQAFLSPEQLPGMKPTPESDFYSLGVVFYHVLTGKLPPARGRESQESEEARESLALENTTASLLPPVARLLIGKLLASDPLERFSSADELCATIRAMRDDSPRAEGKKVEQGWRATPRQYLALALLAMLLVIFWLVITSNKP